jgi:hypothetical protein
MESTGRQGRRISVYLPHDDFRRFELLVARLGETQQEFMQRLMRPVLDAVKVAEPRDDE